MQLAKMITLLCQKRGWTMALLARKSGVPKPTLHGWSTGRNVMNMAQLKKVAATLEVGIHELLFGEPDPFERPGEEILKELFTGDVRVSIHKIDRKPINLKK